MNESYYINKCLQLVEEKTGWRKSESWTLKHFKILSEQISEASHILISYQTLKRLYGKVKTSESYHPQLDTKNALAIFLGYKDWEAFVNASATQTDSVPPRQQAADVSFPVHANAAIQADAVPIPTLEKTSYRPERVEKKKHPFFFATGNVSKSIAKVLAVVVFITTIGVVYLGASFTHFSNKEASPAYSYSFTANKLKGKAPFTVVFNYDISKIKSDKVYIHFGGETDTVPLPKDKSTITFPYFVADLYTVKLIVDGKIIAQEKVHVVSNDWEGYVEQDKKYTYISSPKFIAGGNMYISPEEVQARGTNMNEIFRVHYRNIQDFKADGDDLTFETRFMQHAIGEDSRYFGIAFYLIGEEGYTRIHFINPGCQGYLKLAFGEVYLNGQYHDLSAFAKDLSQWHTARLEVNAKKAQVYFDEKLIYSTTYQQPIGKLKGIDYAFRGYNSVDYLKLWNAQKQLVYSDDFE